MTRSFSTKRRKDDIEIPGPLRFLIFLSLGIAIIVPSTILSDGVTVDGHFVSRYEWWTNGSGFLLVGSLVPFVTSGVLMMKRTPFARITHLIGWVSIYVSGFIVLRINGVPLSTAEAWSYAGWGVAQAAAVAAYLHFSRRVRAYFQAPSLPESSERTRRRIRL